MTKITFKFLLHFSCFKNSRHLFFCPISSFPFIFFFFSPPSHALPYSLHSSAIPSPPIPSSCPSHFFPYPLHSPCPSPSLIVLFPLLRLPSFYDKFISGSLCPHDSTHSFLHRRSFSWQLQITNLQMILISCKADAHDVYILPLCVGDTHSHCVLSCGHSPLPDDPLHRNNTAITSSEMIPLSCVLRPYLPFSKEYHSQTHPVIILL